MKEKLATPAVKIEPATCRAARALLGVTQSQLASLSGISPATINHYETMRHVPQPKVLSALELAFKKAGVAIFSARDAGGLGVMMRTAHDSSAEAIATLRALSEEVAPRQTRRLAARDAHLQTDP